MKKWQCGFELEYLKDIEGKFSSDYNNFAYSPFVEFKKNSIAKSLSKDRLVIGDDFAFETFVLQRPSRVKMYTSYDIVTATKLAGDRVIDKLTGNTDRLIEEINKIEGDCFLYLLENHEDKKRVPVECGFKKVGVKINTFSDVIGLYYRGSEREFPIHDELEYATLIKCQLPDLTNLSVALKNRLKELKLEFTNHYSNYNSQRSWSAISLRGYLPDFSFITKPEEMSKKWQEENSDQAFELQDTELRARFPEVEELVSHFSGKIHRIRFMSLSSHGRLNRHTDQVDPDAGVVDGKLMRFHFPIETNEHVVFSSWDCDGTEHNVQMSIGECWYLDARKPHQAVNMGDEDRIHLVIDVESNEQVRSLLEKPE